MNARHILFLLACLLSFGAAGKEFEVPDTGSVWTWRMERCSSGEADHCSVGGPQSVTVNAMRFGRPVFTVGGRADIFEHDDGIALVENGCKGKLVPVAPTFAPNQCGWNPCSIAPGEVIKRKLYVYTTYNDCNVGTGMATYVGREPKVLTLFARNVSTTWTEASIDSPLWRGKWNPHILAGTGEVYSWSAYGAEKSVYEAVNVRMTRVRFTDASVQSPAVLVHTPVSPLQFACPKQEAGITTVVGLGDSLTRYVGNSYLDNLEKLYEGKSVRFLNAGVPGNTTEDILLRADSVLACGAKFVFVTAGGNDAFRGVPRDEFAVRLKSLIVKLQSGGATVLLLGLELGDKFPYNGIYTAVAKETGVLCIPNIMAGVFNNKAMLREDLTHPNDDGNELIARRVADVISLQKAF